MMPSEIQLINVQNISLYTCLQHRAMTDTSKTAKIIRRCRHKQVYKLMFCTFMFAVLLQ